MVNQHLSKRFFGLLFVFVFGFVFLSQGLSLVWNSSGGLCRRADCELQESTYLPSPGTETAVWALLRGVVGAITALPQSSKHSHPAAHTCLKSLFYGFKHPLSPLVTCLHMVHINSCRHTHDVREHTHTQVQAQIHLQNTTFHSSSFLPFLDLAYGSEAIEMREDALKMSCACPWCLVYSLLQMVGW